MPPCTTVSSTIFVILEAGCRLTANLLSVGHELFTLLRVKPKLRSDWGAVRVHTDGHSDWPMHGFDCIAHQSG